MVQVEVLETTELGDRSYIAHDGTTAIVVDPQRDIDRVEALLAARGLALEAVAETHLHNDYVTGGAALARRAGAGYLVCADDDDPPAVFTGGSLLYGSVGRTDLLGTEHAEQLTRQQFRSARRLSEALDDDARIFPTHGFGSFCSAGSASGVDRSTMGEEREQNDALTADGEDGFVEELLASLTPYPRYYAHMGDRNLAGPRSAGSRTWSTETDPRPTRGWSSTTCAASSTGRSSTCARRTSGSSPRSPARCTCRSTWCPTGWRSCPATRGCGCTARRGSGHRSPPACWPGTGARWC